MKAFEDVSAPLFHKPSPLFEQARDCVEECTDDRPLAMLEGQGARFTRIPASMDCAWHGAALRSPSRTAKDVNMERRLLRSIASSALISVATTGCHASMSTPSSPDSITELPKGSYTNVGAEWPLKFKAHYFGAHCFDTESCSIVYRGFPHGPKDRPAPSASSYGRPLDKLLTAGRGPIPNFPPPAQVTWRSKDGASHEVEIDIGEIFKDELIRHLVAQEDALDPASSGMPSIILEVNDRTINVYMRAMIALKKPQFPDRPHSDFRDDLIKVFSRTY